MELRSQYKDAFLEKHGVKLGFMSGFVKVQCVPLSLFEIIYGCSIVDG